MILLVLTTGILFSQESIYFPDRNEWEQRDPEYFGINKSALSAAIDSIKSNEYTGPTDLRQAILKGFEREPYHKILGPTKRRGGPAGMILKNGYIIAQWGDVKRVDMTFSVTKSYLSTIAGLAKDQNLIKSMTDKVNTYVWDHHFDGAHNSMTGMTDHLNMVMSKNGKRREWQNQVQKWNTMM